MRNRSKQSKETRTTKCLKHTTSTTLLPIIVIIDFNNVMSFNLLSSWHPFCIGVRVLDINTFDIWSDSLSSRSVIIIRCRLFYAGVFFFLLFVPWNHSHFTLRMNRSRVCGEPFDSLDIISVVGQCVSIGRPMIACCLIWWRHNWIEAIDQKKRRSLNKIKQRFNGNVLEYLRMGISYEMAS